MNITEILKNAPKGTKLYSPICGECELVAVIPHIYYPIRVQTKVGIYSFTDSGLVYKDEHDGECMLFPSKDNRDWNNFSVCPFKKGDFIVRKYPNGHKYIAIFSHIGFPFKNTVNYMCVLYPDRNFGKKPNYGIGGYQEVRFATEEEKEELLDAIERNGYIWNSDTLTLEEIHKYNIYSLKPFDKVLVRDDTNDIWKADFYSHYEEEATYHFRCVGTQYIQCIPYNNETRHLLGTKKECPEYYKNW